MTERRQMLASLAEKERLASVGMLAASVAHEIMNPLTYVLANLDFVVGERSVDPARNTKALVEAREGARRMQQIVWDLRALGRAGGEELFYVDARSVLEIALRLSGPEVARTASVVLELDEVPCVLASESRLCQVFINLLVNAAQAMESATSPRAARSASRRATTRTRAWSASTSPTTAKGISAGPPRADLRAVLHDEAVRHRPRALDLSRHRRAHGRSHRRREQPGERHDVHGVALDDARRAGACRRVVARFIVSAFSVSGAR